MRRPIRVLKASDEQNPKDIPKQEELSSDLRQSETLVDIQIVWSGHWESVTWIQDFDSGLVKIGSVIGDTQPQLPPYDSLHQQEAWYSWPMPRLLIQTNYKCLIHSCQSISFRSQSPILFLDIPKVVCKWLHHCAYVTHSSQIFGPIYLWLQVNQDPHKQYWFNLNSVRDWVKELILALSLLMYYTTIF